MYYEFKNSIKGIVYWCDTMGHLHHNDDYDLRSPKELPKELQVALGNLWVKGTYLVEFNGRYGAAIEASYDQDLANTLSISYADLKEFAKAKAKEYAKKYPELDVIFGNDTTEWNDGSVETTILVICPWDMKERDFFDVELYIKSTKYTNINTEKNPEENSVKTEEPEGAEDIKVTEAAKTTETGCKKIYSFDNFEGDKGIIIATSREEAIAIYKKKYQDRQVAEDDGTYYNHGCYILERCNLDDAELVVAAEW